MRHDVFHSLYTASLNNKVMVNVNVDLYMRASSWTHL